ncbi:MAG TPA: hypothetical protein VI895_14935 [Bdellovibrionota bacterium]|nr:hypothetical protein [Bdellovibrionota bacterium]
MVGIASLTCAKISGFDEPYVQESFLGAVGITPSLRGMYPSAKINNLITIVGDENGRAVTIYGLPDNKPFELWARSEPFEPPPTVSGLEADVVDSQTLSVTGFSSVNEAAEALDLEVSGTLVREGPRLSTLPGKPIVVRATAGKVKQSIPSQFRDRIKRISDGATIDEIDEDEIVPLYQFNVGAQITSIF